MLIRLVGKNDRCLLVRGKIFDVDAYVAIRDQDNRGAYQKTGHDPFHILIHWQYYRHVSAKTLALSAAHTISLFSPTNLSFT